MCKQLLAALALLVVNKCAEAQCLGSCCSAGCSTDITNHTMMNNKGDWQLSAAYSIMQYHPFSDEELKQWSTMENATFTVRSQQSIKLGLSYNITDRWKVSASIPYNFSFDNREGHTHESDYKEVHDYGDISGAGDATLIGSYEWMAKNEKGWHFATGIGIKAPTGQTQTLSSNNIVAPPHLQPGTGSWDPVATVNVKKEWERWMFAGDAYGKIATTANDHNMGNYTSATASGFWKWFEKPDHFISSVTLFGAAQSDYNSKIKMPMNHLGGTVDHTAEGAITPFDNSGFTRVFASGGALIGLGKHVTIPVNFSLPVYEHLNGYQVRMQWKSTIGVTLQY